MAGEVIADWRCCGTDQPGLFGAVASDPTAWRVLSSVDSAGLDRLRAARARCRESSASAESKPPAHR